MQASESLVVAFAVDRDVFLVPFFELGHGRLDVFHAPIRAHLGGGNVGMETSAVPIAGDRLGCKGNRSAEFFGDPVKQPARHPEVIAHYTPIS